MPTYGNVESSPCVYPGTIPYTTEHVRFTDRKHERSEALFRFVSSTSVRCYPCALCATLTGCFTLHHLPSIAFNLLLCHLTVEQYTTNIVNQSSTFSRLEPRRPWADHNGERATSRYIQRTARGIHGIHSIWNQSPKRPCQSSGNWLSFSRAKWKEWNQQLRRPHARKLTSASSDIGRDATTSATNTTAWKMTTAPI